MNPSPLDYVRSTPQSTQKSRRSPVSSRFDPEPIPLVDLLRYSRFYLEDCESAGQSRQTVIGKRDVVEKLVWFLKREKADACGESELRRFMIYLQNGHMEKGGRWGNPRFNKPVGQRTICYYFIYLQGMFRWMQSQRIIEQSPMEYMTKPKRAAPPPVRIYEPEDIEKLLLAARKTPCPRREIALVLFLYDTGVRASELCDLRVGDVDVFAKRFAVTGKGKKTRELTFSTETAMALKEYLDWRGGYLDNKRKRRVERKGIDPRRYALTDESPLFATLRTSAPLNRDSLLKLIKRLGNEAGLQIKCNNHLFRHSAATEMTRRNASGALVRSMLGHTTNYMTDRYIHLSGGDVREQHRQYSPVSNLRKRLRER